LKWTLKSLLRRFGYDLVRYAPETMRPLDVLGLAVRYRLQVNPDFFFVQIGANDGVRDDPLRALVLEHHLRGLLVEPLPDFFEALRANYAGEEQLRFEHAAITASGEASMTLHRFHPDAPIADNLHGLATANAAQLRALAREDGVEQHIQEEEVPCMTLAALLEKHAVRQISLLQVDTEGHDYEILQMAMETGVFPEMINYEFLHLHPADRLAARRLLIGHGYSLVDSEIDTFAMREV